jgi:hypothetical protein
MNELKTDLAKEVYNYVVNENFDGNKNDFYEVIVADRGFGGSPWYKHVPDYVREMNIRWDEFLGDEVINDLSMVLYKLETEPYFEGTLEGIDVNDKYYDGFNKPKEEWTDEEWDEAWEYHTYSESSTEVYQGIISYLETEVPDYLFSQKHKEMKEFLSTFIDKEEIEEYYFDTTDCQEDVYEYDYDNGKTQLRLYVCTGGAGELNGGVSVEDNDWNDLFEESFDTTEQLKSLFPKFKKYLK